MKSFPKPVRERSKSYLAWIRLQYCVAHTYICANHAIEANHIIPKGGGRTGSKVDDSRALPFCAEHHRWYHTAGRDTFANEYGIDLEHQIRQYNARYRAEHPLRKKKEKAKPDVLHITHGICGQVHRVKKETLSFYCQRLRSMVRI